MKFVDLDRVSLRYGEDADGTLALHRATLHVGDGEFVAVVGPSGCGKSMILVRVLALALLGAPAAKMIGTSNPPH